MCGIVGYIGHRRASDVLVDGLQRLSYRGYDSAGVAVLDEQGKIAVRKTSGKLARLQELLSQSPVNGTAGIGHTRWATHGEPSDLNAHPHTDVQGGIAVVHNGIIENHETLRRHLESCGAVFRSETDTEVIAHLLNVLDNGDMLHTLLRAQSMLKGSYAVGVLCAGEPDKLFCMRSDSPLVAGFRDGEGFIASDVPALLSHTRDVLFLHDREVGVLTRGGMQVYDEYGRPCGQTFTHVDWDVASAEKGGFAHYMLKEIHEQPSALQSTFAPRGRLSDLQWLPISREEALRITKITIAACGTAYHAALIGRCAMEQLARIPAEADIASEYRYRQPVIGENELFIAVSQSGETADTLAALREAKRRGAQVMAVCNAVGSSIAREAGEKNTLYTYAGPEIAVASTKAYVTQTALLIQLAAAVGTLRGNISQERAEKLYKSLRELPAAASETLQLEPCVQQIASRLVNLKHVFFVGRGADYALAMEAALKLKEVSYIFSEACAAGELKHGPIALLQPGRLVAACITQPHVLDKMLSNLQEVRARGAAVLAVCPKAMADRVQPHADDMIVIPDTDEWLSTLLAAIPLQPFAYCMAVARGCDVDQPRNLAKSVTVE